MKFLVLGAAIAMSIAASIFAHDNRDERLVAYNAFVASQQSIEPVYNFPTATHTPTATATATATLTPTLTPTVTPTPTPIPIPTFQAHTASAASVINIEGCGQLFISQVAQWWDLIIQYDWDPCAALRIINCESKGDPWVYNFTGSGACGLWQHLPCQYPGDAVGSTALAYQKYASRGWQPWIVGGCYPY